MGYSASSYRLFKALTDIESDRFLYLQAKILLDPFDIFSFIIYDPKKDKDFASYLKTEFSYLDKITGSHLLFFCLLKQKPLNRESFKFFNFFERDSWRLDRAAEESSDLSLSTQALCHYLGINYDSIPCICVTTDFSFNSFYTINTDHSNIETQLWKLTETANFFHSNRIKDNKYLEQVLKSYSNEQQGLFSFNKIELQEDAFSNKINSFLGANKLNDTTYESQEVFKISYEAIKNLSQPSLQGNEFELREQKLLSQVSLAGIFYTNYKSNLELEYYAREDKRNKKKEQRYAPLPLTFNDEGYLKASDIEGLEAETKNWFNLSFSYEKFLALSFDKEDLLDYSGYAITLCKAMEKEINLSIVQWIRQHLGIEMPSFFNVIKPGDNTYLYLIDKSIISNPRPVSFNKQSRMKWLPPGLGESALCFKSILSNEGSNAFDYLTQEKQNFLIQHWINLNIIRQKVAHSELVPLGEKNNLNNIIGELYSSGIISTIIKLKENLRN